MKIGLDFDGVISDCGRLKSEVAKEIYDMDIPRDLFKKEILLENGVMSSGQYRHLQKMIYHTMEYGLRMEPVKDSFKFINKLKELGYQIEVITSRHGSSLRVAKEWCKKNNLNIKKFTGVGYGKSKVDACKGLDIYIDDDLDKIIPLVDIVPNRFLFSWGYNKHILEQNHAKRIFSWREFFEEVVSLQVQSY